MFNPIRWKLKAIAKKTADEYMKKHPQVFKKILFRIAGDQATNQDVGIFKRIFKEAMLNVAARHGIKVDQ